MALRPKIVEQIKGDPRLDPLRTRDDSQTLLTSSEKAMPNGKEAFARGR